MNDTTHIHHNHEHQQATQEAANHAVMQEHEFTFNFRTKKDEQGNEVKPEPVKLKVQVPTLAYFGITPNAEDKKQALLQDLVTDTVYEAIRPYVDAHVKDGKELDLEAIANAADWEVISNKPKAERKVEGVSKDQLEALSESFSKVMLAKGKAEKGVKVSTDLFKKRTKGMENMRPEIVEAIQANLAAWFTEIAEDEQEAHAAAYEMLTSKMDEILQADTAALF